MNANSKTVSKVLGNDFRTSGKTVELNYDYVRKCFFHPQVKEFRFWVQGAFSFHAHVHPSTVEGFRKHTGYLPGSVECTWHLDGWNVNGFCTWVQIWDEVNQQHWTKIVAGTDRYGSVLYVDERFLELQRGNKLSNA